MGRIRRSARIRIFTFFVLPLATLTAAADPVLFDGRYFEVVIASRISWPDAKAAAEGRSYNGVEGHLVTIGSRAEDEFVDTLRRQVAGESGSEFWVGGYQTSCATAAPEPACGWLWINGEPISPTNTASPYTNWQSGQPNNATPSAKEDFLAIGAGSQPGWNDEGSTTPIAGYVVEYGDSVTVPATTCTEAIGCNPTGGQIQQYPDSAVVQLDATLTARTWLIHDDPARCGVLPLELFDRAVIVPPYLCGHPDFLVIETATSGVEITSGAIDVENLTEEALPGNLYGCTGVMQNPPGVIDLDPSHRDVVAWQASDAAEMLETSRGTGRFFGTLVEVTYGCGSSRGKVVSGSYHFVGLRIHPGLGNEFTDHNPQGNHQSFIELTRYKLEMLRASVLDSEVALSKQSYAKLKGTVDAAIAAHERRRFARALEKVTEFLSLVASTDYATLPSENFSGAHIMRASNIQFMYAQKVIPFEQ
jgi:hypothetical protein